MFRSKMILWVVGAITIILVGVPIGASGRQGAAGGSTAPNILLILVDDLGWGDLSTHGAGDLRTPHLDRLISEGIRFDNFYSNSPVCSPTRAALLTGRYQDLVGVPGVIRTDPADSWGHLSEDVVLLPESLERQGYDTALIGKWHLGLESPNTPTDRGFAYFKGFLGDMMDDYFTHRRHGRNYMSEGKAVIDPPGHATDLFTEWACQYLRSRETSQKPFFLFLSYNAPHAPVQPPFAWLERYRQWEFLADEKRARLCAFIEHLDHGIGQVMHVLREAALERETLVVFSSDNGGRLADAAHNGPYRSGKQLLYEGGIRVPAALRWPGRIRPGSRSQMVALSMDLFPTLLEAGGGALPKGLDAVSLLPVLFGQQSELPRRTVFFGRREKAIRGITSPEGVTVYAVRRDHWKLLEPYPGGKPELYDLNSDPMERRDLSRSHTREFAELLGVLREQTERYKAVNWKGPYFPVK